MQINIMNEHDKYSRSEQIFPKVNVYECARLYQNLAEGAKIGSVEIQPKGHVDKFLFLSVPQLAYLRLGILARLVPSLDAYIRDVGVKAWSPINDRGTVDDFFDFFVKRIRDEGQIIEEGSALPAYRERVDRWNRNHNS